MQKKYKVAVSDTVVVTVKASIADNGGKPVPHKFTLTCQRRGAAEMLAEMEGGFNAKAFMKEVTTGWEGQRLVLNEDGSPAEFESDALDALLDISGMAMVCFAAYGNAASAQGKN